MIYLVESNFIYEVAFVLLMYCYLIQEHFPQLQYNNNNNNNTPSVIWRIDHGVDKARR